MDLNQAIVIATSAHQGQVDKGGNPYILHPLRILLKMETEEERIVAVLHDVIEDTGVTMEDLQTAGFSQVILQALGAITRRNDESYNEYLHRVNEDSLARKVKIEDLKDNSDLSRILRPTEKDRSRAKKYKRSIEKLTARE